MTGPDPLDGTASLAVHGDASFPPGVPVPPSPPEAAGPASRAPERDATAGPRSVPLPRSGDQAAKPQASTGRCLAANWCLTSETCERLPDCEAACSTATPPVPAGKPGLSGPAFLAEVRRVQAEQGRQRRGDPGRRARAAQRATPAYKPGGNRRGGRQ